MTITASVPRNDYVGNGATTVFPYTFKIFTSSEIEIQLDGVVQTLGFTVSGVGATGGGNVTFSVAPANTVKVLLLGKTARSQSTDWVENDPLTAQTIEDAVDRLTRSVQELDEALGRTLGFKKSSLQSGKVLDDLVASKYLQVKSDASGIQMVDVVQLVGSISSISGLNTNRIPYGINTTSLTTIAGFTFDGTSLTLPSGPHTINGFFTFPTSVVVPSSTLAYIGPGATSGDIRINVPTGRHYEWLGNGGEIMRLTDSGILLIGTTVATNAVAGALVLTTGAGAGSAIRFPKNAPTDTFSVITTDSNDRVQLGAGATDILWGKPLVALGGGAAPTLGTIGGSGPAAAAQSHWLRFIDTGGTVRFMAVWT